VALLCFSRSSLRPEVTPYNVDYAQPGFSIEAKHNNRFTWLNDRSLLTHQALNSGGMHDRSHRHDTVTQNYSMHVLSKQCRRFKLGDVFLRWANINEEYLYRQVQC